MNKFNAVALANALAAATGLVSLLCAFSIILFPEFSLSIAQSWFHGLDLSKISGSKVTVESLIIGLVTMTTGAWAVGYVFAEVYNFSAKEK